MINELFINIICIVSAKRQGDGSGQARHREGSAGGLFNAIRPKRKRSDSLPVLRLVAFTAAWLFQSIPGAQSPLGET